VSSPRRLFCADVSRNDHEPLIATASRVERWLLVEYRSLWTHDAAGGSTLSTEVKQALRVWVDAERRSRLLFIRRRDRRHREGISAFVARSREKAVSLRRFELERYDDLLELPLDEGGEPVDRPLFLVCTHGKHDRCCARLGRPLYDSLAEVLEEEHVWQCSHVGGDRFAGNLLVLPHGLYLGRVEPDEAWAVAEELLGGRIPLDRDRGRSCHTFPSQAAERAIREATGLTGFDELGFAGIARLGSGWRVRFETVAGELWEARVERREGDPTYLTCSAAELRRPRRYVAESPPERVA
jgi:hypothetical protein